MISADFVRALEEVVGVEFVKRDAESLHRYGADAMKRSQPPDVVVLPGSTEEISRVARLCNDRRIPLVPRGGGTGYTGGAVPTHGGVVLSLERLNRILEIDEASLLAVVEPNVITADLQQAVEALGLFYPPDPASSKESVIGGNVAECAGGPRAFKYGVTKRYVLGLEAVLPTGEIVKTGSRAVKNVVGYDLTQLLVGSEGTLAIITKVILRLIPKPPVQSTLRASFPDVRSAVAAVGGMIRAGVVPAALELIDDESLKAIARYSVGGVGALGDVGRACPDAGPTLRSGGAEAGAGTRGDMGDTGAVLLIEVDGLAESVVEEARRVEAACVAAGATAIVRARDEAERQELWRLRRELSPALKTIPKRKVNHDVVVPKGRIPALFDLVERLRRDFGLLIPCFGHVGDGNIHVNIMVTPDDGAEVERGKVAERLLFEGVVALGGSISGEHGIGFTKKPFLSIELSPEEIALMKRVKQAFDPNGILNPGKIFPD